MAARRSKAKKSKKVKLTPKRRAPKRRAPKRRAPKRRAPKARATKRSAKPKPGLDALARKIVRATQQPDFVFTTLYTADCTSAEPMGEPARGHAGLDEKNARWAQMQSSSKWTARNVWTGKKTICIEWDGEVQLRDGRNVLLREIAVHEIKDGKIQHERYYYNPMALAPAAAPTA